MYTGLLHFHSYFRYIALALLIIIFVKALLGWLSGNKFETIDDKLSLWTLIALHIQTLLGIVLYFVSPNVQLSGAAMKDANLRYWSVEHLTMMLLAVIIYTIARISIKKMTDSNSRFRRLAIFSGSALAIIIISILQSGRGLL
ncbi:MAG: cytochrome B [Sphingobacteriales bacterium]|nr:cytochrome B [Sphingobacteriales bacterium]